MADAGVEGDTSGDLLPIEAKWLYLAFYGLIGLWIVYLLASMDGWRWEDWSLPLIAGIPGVVLVVVHGIRLIAPERYAALNPFVREAEEDETLDDVLEDYGVALEDESSRPPRQRQLYELLMIAWVIALPVAMQYLGFFLALPLYVFAFGVYFTRDWKRSLAIAVGFTVFIYVFFGVLIGAKIYAGELGIQPDVPVIRLF
ncbi:MAG: tripartite tricarboxylate transporter TctB family protein [Halobacteriales archaeon]|nr:tripartite tricarboxylate transporter TctB family protein [Halobacteriales archaeon]